MADEQNGPYYLKGKHIYKRPVRLKQGVQMGFRVCTVDENLANPSRLVELLNKADPITKE